MNEQYNNNKDEITFFGETNFRNQRKKFGIKVDDRRKHMYIIGKTGMGKTTLQENMIVQDINNEHSVAYLDPHGDIADKLLDYIPANRINDVVYFNPGDLQHPIAFNVLESVEYEHKHLVASGLMGVFTKIWANLWSARMEYILNNCILALLEVPGNTLLGIMRILVDKEFRKKIVSQVKDPIVKSFWTNEYANWNERFRTEAIQPIQNKVGQFLSSSIIRNIVGQPKSTIDLRDIMDNRKILIMNLSKGKIGEDASALLGAMMVTKLQLAAMSRVDLPEEERQDFYLYVDEFQNYSTESFADILSEARKYRLNLILAHQYIAQLDDKVRDAVFGNMGTMITFRIGAEDAEAFEKEFDPYIRMTDLVNLPKYRIFLKLMIDGVASRPFSANTLAPMHEGSKYLENREKVINVSRERYSKPSKIVEEKIVRWLNPEEVAKETAIGASLAEEEEAYVHQKQTSQKPIAGKQARFPLKEGKKQLELNAVCDNCNKPTHVSFQPDEFRNVFCKDCLKKFKNGEIDVATLTKRNINNANQRIHTNTSNIGADEIKIESKQPDLVKNNSMSQTENQEQLLKINNQPVREMPLSEVMQQQPVKFHSRKTNMQKKSLEPGKVVKFNN